MKKTILGIILVAITAVMMAGCSLTYDGNDVGKDDSKTKQEQETTTEEKDGCLDDGLFY